MATESWSVLAGVLWRSHWRALILVPKSWQKETYPMWDIATEEAPKKLLGCILMKSVRMQTEYMIIRKTRLTLHWHFWGPSWFFFWFFFSHFGHVGDVSPVISKAGIAIRAKTITYCSDLVVFIKKYLKKIKFSIDLFFFIKEKRLHFLQIWSFSLKNRFWSDTDFSLRNIKKNYVLYKFSLYY